ncbi:hypothetical protein A3709_10550 [Halioglobus sp. HI00S01]|uniref:hypothetical protein n=1 Tax=Halioglobus sp. HI00S01 TaxID=1822214 RepID=UPI0007C4067A|nr:hypothetical protein [Halioglobus sp. HI00S01]KZX51260.1 hypothetical protein A3709_10550 [Halioglobus sp. HI00S01]
MAAIFWGSDELVRQMEEVGISRAQASAIAKGTATMVVQNFNALVTNDYLDARFTASKSELDAKIEKRFVEVNLRFERAEGKFRLMFWMQAITFAALVLPSLRDFIR